MELGLSLGDQSTTPFSFLDKATQMKRKMIGNKNDHQLGFCMALGRSDDDDHDHDQEKKREALEDEGHDRDDQDDEERFRSRRSRVSSDPDHDHDSNNIHVPLQLDLLPSVPVPRGHMTTSQFRFPWLTDNYGSGKGFDVNRLPAAAAEEATEEGVTISSPNSTLSSFHMDFCVRTRDNNNIHNNMINSNNKRSDTNSMTELEAERASSRASDDEENGSTRKKLRLSKEQSAFLEESFKEHSTLNPKQKLALAKQLNLRPRQVEVWFQNRRARTKLKQTEVDCEYLKRCCETLTEENRRLQKELQELRALKTSQPFYMQLPATTLTMCPSCERVATANSAAVSGNSPAGAKPFPHHAQAGKA